MGDRFYLCDNKILCEYDYEERLVFASMAANPSGLAHIRRQVSGLQVITQTNIIYPPHKLRDYTLESTDKHHCGWRLAYEIKIIDYRTNCDTCPLNYLLYDVIFVTYKHKLYCLTVLSEICIH